MPFPTRHAVTLAACAAVVNMLSITQAHAMEPAEPSYESCAMIEEGTMITNAWSDSVDCSNVTTQTASALRDDSLHVLEPYLMLTDAFDAPLTEIEAIGATGGTPESDSLITFTLSVTGTSALVGNALFPTAFLSRAALHDERVMPDCPELSALAANGDESND
jgi:hypothetical protein